MAMASALATATSNTSAIPSMTAVTSSIVTAIPFMIATTPYMVTAIPSMAVSIRRAIPSRFPTTGAFTSFTATFTRTTNPIIMSILASLAHGWRCSARN